MSKAVCCLGIYAAITTIIIAILSWIISEDVACSQVNNVTGTDNKIRSSTNYEFLNFDNRKSKDGDESCTCSSWGFLGIEAFEFLLIGAFIIYLVFKGFRRICGEGGYIQKRKETKWKRDAEKFEKLKSKFESVAETKGPEQNNTKEAATSSDRVAIVLFRHRVNQKTSS